MTPESLKQAANASKQMHLEEAYKILGTDSQAGIEEVMKVRTAIIVLRQSMHMANQAQSMQRILCMLHIMRQWISSMG